MTDQTPDTIRALADRLERRADIEDVGEVRYPQTEETDAAYEETPEVTWGEMREIVGLLRESAATLRALADQSQRVQEGCVVLSEADVMDQLSAQAWCQGVRPAIEAKSADEFVAKMINALRSEAAPAPTGAPHACDEGWICEAHPGQPWPHDACLGPGMPCPCGRAFRTSEAQARAERRPATPAPTEE